MQLPFKPPLYNLVALSCFTQFLCTHVAVYFVSETYILTLKTPMVGNRLRAAARNLPGLDSVQHIEWRGGRDRGKRDKNEIKNNLAQEFRKMIGV